MIVESTEERRPQAGPLPQKRGEIGYQEGIEGQQEPDQNVDVTPLPPRHPADRPPELPPAREEDEASASAAPPPLPSAGAQPPPFSSAPSDTVASSLHKPPKRSGGFLSSLDPRPALQRKKFGGVTLGTILRLASQCLFLAGTIVLWIVVSKLLAHKGSKAATGPQDDGRPAPAPILGGSASIFLHICFGAVTLVEFFFLERCIFLVRAQRYAHKHHGASLPTHRSQDGTARGIGNIAMSFAPWNRPPLPTYAAALAQSGVGTGDVEDNLIAIPPPPAYGHTRGSTLLLAGHIRDSLRAAIPPEIPGSRPASQTSHSIRPISYRSNDEEWEQRRYAERAMHLADSLERLEQPARSADGRAR